MNTENFKEYLSAVMFLPENLRYQALKLRDLEKCEAEEIRLRIGKPLSIKLTDKEMDISDKEPCIVMPNDIMRLIENVTSSSLHTHSETIKNGFISAKGGHRLGLCGTVVLKDGQLYSMRNFSSVNLRIAKEKKDISQNILTAMQHKDGKIENTLIISKPGAGKTTLLRDMVRNLSNSGIRVGIVDERGEIAASYMGIPQFDIGRHSDVLSGCPKKTGIEALIRVMSPEIVAVDEITCEQDVQAIENAMYCGVSIFATVHASHMNDFKNRPIYHVLRKTGIFEHIITVSVENGKREYLVSKWESELPC